MPPRQEQHDLTFAVGQPRDCVVRIGRDRPAPPRAATERPQLALRDLDERRRLSLFAALGGRAEGVGSATAVEADERPPQVELRPDHLQIEAERSGVVADRVEPGSSGLGVGIEQRLDDLERDLAPTDASSPCVPGREYGAGLVGAADPRKRLWPRRAACSC